MPTLIWRGGGGGREVPIRMVKDTGYRDSFFTNIRWEEDGGSKIFVTYNRVLKY